MYPEKRKDDTTQSLDNLDDEFDGIPDIYHNNSFYGTLRAYRAINEHFAV